MLAVIAAHVAAGLSLAAAVGPGAILLCGSLALAASLAWLLVRGLQGLQTSSLTIAADGICRWSAGHGTLEGTLSGDSTALPWLVMLRIAMAGERGSRTLIVCEDSMGRDDWRRLRVFLRWGVRLDGAAPAPSREPY